MPTSRGSSLLACIVCLGLGKVDFMLVCNVREALAPALQPVWACMEEQCELHSCQAGKSERTCVVLAGAGLPSGASGGRA